MVVVQERAWRRGEGRDLFALGVRIGRVWAWKESCTELNHGCALVLNFWRILVCSGDFLGIGGLKM